MPVVFLLQVLVAAFCISAVHGQTYNAVQCAASRRRLLYLQDTRFPPVPISIIGIYGGEQLFLKFANLTNGCGLSTGATVTCEFRETPAGPLQTTDGEVLPNQTVACITPSFLRWLIWKVHKQSMRYWLQESFHPRLSTVSLAIKVNSQQVHLAYLMVTIYPILRLVPVSTNQAFWAPFLYEEGETVSLYLHEINDANTGFKTPVLLADNIPVGGVSSGTLGTSNLNIQLLLASKVFRVATLYFTLKNSSTTSAVRRKWRMYAPIDLWVTIIKRQSCSAVNLLQGFNTSKGSKLKGLVVSSWKPHTWCQMPCWELIRNLNYYIQNRWFLTYFKFLVD